MAEKEINIKVNAKADKTEVEDLATAMEDLKNSTENAEQSTEQFKESTSSMDGEGFDTVKDSADETKESVDNTTQSTENFKTTTESMDGSGFDNVKDKADETKESVDGLNESTSTMVDGLAAATISSGIVSGMDSMVGAAGSYSDTMVRLGYAIDGTSMSAEQAEQRYGSLISTMTSETGRGAGAVRQHLINMGNVGITNEQVLSDSFEAISKSAFQMGTSIESSDQKFQRMVLSGTVGARQLYALGLNTQDLANVMGVSVDEVSDSFKNLDETSRASVLASALNMKFGSDVTENYKNSYEHLTESVDRAKDYLIRSVGEAILPYVIPAMTTAADVINMVARGFRSLPSPIQGVIGGSIALVGGMSAAGLAISGVVKIVSSAAAPFIKLINILTGSNLKGIMDLAKAFGTLGKSVLTAGLNALKSVAMWVAQKIAIIASRVATVAATIAQWALNVAMTMNPIGIIIMAIVALIAVLTYLYFNNEQVRQAIDALGQAFVQAGQWIWNGIIWALQQVSLAFQNFNNYLMSVRQMIINHVVNTVNWIIMSLVSFIVWFYTLPGRIAVVLANIIGRAISFASGFISNIINAGSRAVNGFMNYISSLPGRLATELNNMLSTVGQWAATLPQKFWEAGVNAVKNFLSALGIASPGTMQRMIVWEVTEMGKRIPRESRNLIANVGKMGKDIVSSFGNPKLKLDYGSNINSRIVDTANKDNEPSQVINFYFNDTVVDDDKRMQKIVDYITKKLAWNNKTAGRTI